MGDEIPPIIQGNHLLQITLVIVSAPACVYTSNNHKDDIRNKIQYEECNIMEGLHNHEDQVVIALNHIENIC